MLFSPRVAWSMALACVCWQLVARAGQVLDWMTFRGELSASVLVVTTLAIAALIGAQVLVSLERGPQRLLLIVMAVLVFAPAPLAGPVWPDVAGLLCAAILLTVRPPLSWVLFCLVCGADAMLAGLVNDQSGVVVSGRVWVTINSALTLFAVTRLARLIQETHDARVAAVRMSVEIEHLRSATRLRSALGSQLARLITNIRDASARAVTTRDDVTRVARLARQAAETARRVVDERVREEVPRLPVRTAPPADDYALSWGVSILLTVMFACIAVTNVVWDGVETAGTWAVVAVVAPVAGALHLYHATPRADGGSPRWWPWTVTAQALIVLAAVAAVGTSLLLYVILVAGAVVTRMRAPWSWCVLPVLFATGLVFPFLLSPTWTVGASVYYAASFGIGMITVYALCHLPGVASRLYATRAEFARTALVAERLRFARDVHDLLGFHLSAIVLKTEIAARAMDDDPRAARDQLTQIQPVAERAMAELRSIRDTAETITAEEEIAEAASLLRAAGVQVTIDVPDGCFGEAGHVVGVVVREATTNIVRHSRATRCGIRVDPAGEDAIELDIVNDGASADSGERGTGTGIGSLRARVEALGGWLTATRDGDTFRLVARVPLQATGGTRSAVLLEDGRAS